MFSGKYIEWNQNRIKGIIDFYGFKFFYFKKILDLGCGYADISASLLRLGADITAVDARQEHLKIISKKYPEIKTVKADLDNGWPFQGKKFDLILDLDLICHINNYEEHLKNVCASTHHLILETAVCDDQDDTKHIMVPENKGNYDLSFNGTGSRPTSKSIERILKESGMDFRRVDQSRFNSGSYKYDWQEKNNSECDINNRRIWFAVRNDSPIQFVKPTIAAPVLLPLPPPPSPEPPQIYSFPDRINKPNYISVGVPKKFVIVIPSYNNEEWCVRNIESCINQNYENYRVVFTDDASKDETFNRVNTFVSQSPRAHKVTLIRNSTRIGALANLYNMIHSCNDDEIILTLDGDDWLANDSVLNTLANTYSNNDVWMTYGQYQNHPDGGRGIAEAYPEHIISNNAFRSYRWCASHLRTFYSWLFKKIKKEDLFYEGKFLEMTWDLGMMYPMLEMAGHHSKFIPDVLYMYNLINPINDHKVSRGLQQKLDYIIRAYPRYSQVSSPQLRKPSVGLMCIATGKYDRYVQPFISSADAHYLNDEYDVTYYVYTDKELNINSKRKIVYIPIEHRSFPHASMDRFKHFYNNRDKFVNEDYLYYCDVDSLFVNNIGKEIFGELVGVQHCGYVNSVGPYENNPASCLYVPVESYSTYFGGGFSGGTTQKYLELSRWCSEMIDIETNNGRVPLWHDETAINRYFLDHKPNVILTPSYHYPQSNIDYYRSRWAPQTFHPVILLLDKNHEEIRS